MEMSGGRQRYAVIIPLLALGEAFLFAYAMYLNNCPQHSTECLFPCMHRFAFEPLLNNPLLGPLQAPLRSLGALEADHVTKHGQGWRLFTCILLHSGLVHVLVDCIALSVVGIRVEKRYGFFKAVVIYLMGGFAGSLASAIFVRRQYIAGASGATCGLMGSALAALVFNWQRSSHKVEMLMQLFCLLALHMCLGMTPHLNNYSHLAGMGMGFLLGCLLLMRPRAVPGSAGGSPEDPSARGVAYRYSGLQRLLQLLGLLACIAGYAAAFGFLFKKFDTTARCPFSYCKYLSCITTTTWSCVV